MIRKVLSVKPFFFSFSRKCGFTKSVHNTEIKPLKLLNELVGTAELFKSSCSNYSGALFNKSLFIKVQSPQYSTLFTVQDDIVNSFRLEARIQLRPAVILRHFWCFSTFIWTGFPKTGMITFVDSVLHFSKAGSKSVMLKVSIPLMGHIVTSINDNSM